MRKKIGMRNCIDGEMRLESMKRKRQEILITLQSSLESLTVSETYTIGKTYHF